MSKPFVIVILTGAGVSAESGIPTFRDANGLWEGHAIEDVATPEAFTKNPALVHNFYNLRRAAVKGAEPNAAHKALAKLQWEFKGEVVLITQNVDDLHERAGCPEVMHMHGELLKARCTKCRSIFPCEDNLDEAVRCNTCGSAGGLRPHIVWFNEMPLEMEAIQDALDRADLFVAIGTSGNVYPAASFVDLARSAGAQSVEINNAKTQISSLFQQHLSGPATVKVPEFVDEILNGKII